MKSSASIKWFNTKFYPSQKTARSANYETVLERMDHDKIFFFTPWGPRYGWENRGTEIRSEDKEIKTLSKLSELFSLISLNMPEKQFRWMFLGADLYGTRINHLPQKAVGDYFDSFESRLDQIIPSAEFHLWSEFDEQAVPYRRQISSRFSKLVDANLLDRATRTSIFMGKKSDPAEYIVERMAEAILIEDLYRPIKISCAPRHKDDKVDLSLPRLYLLSAPLQAPWM